MHCQGENMKAAYRLIIFFLLAIALFTGMSADDSQKLNIVGSTSVQPICEELVEEYRKTHTDIDINVQGGGSGLAIRSTVSNVSDIGMSSKEVNLSGLQVHELGREGIVLVVNNQNPISDLSTVEIRDIFSGKVTDWSCGSKINVISREEGSGTLSTFKSKIMGCESIRSDAIVQNSPGSVKQAIIKDKNAIGFVALNQVDSSVKVISVDGVYPTYETVSNGSYVLQRPFLLLTNNTPSGETLEFISWTKSSEAREILKSQGIVV